MAMYYMAPDDHPTAQGDDDTLDPTNINTPMLTFTNTISLVTNPGDEVILRDGIYEPGGTSKTGFADLYGPAHGNATTIHGTAANPIVMRAENQRKAHIRGTGFTTAMDIQDLNFWTFDGLFSTDFEVASGTLNTFCYRFQRCNNTIIKWAMFHQSNGWQNCHFVLYDDSNFNLIEDVQFYKWHRHCVVWDHSNDNILRRAYGSSRGYTRPPGSRNDHGPGGDSVFSMYPGDRNIGENVFSDTNRRLHEMNASDQTIGNKIYGCISYKDLGTLFVDSRRDTLNCMPRDGTWKDLVAYQGGIGIKLRATKNMTFSNISVWGDGVEPLIFSADDYVVDQRGDLGYSVNIKDSAFQDSGTTGIKIDEGVGTSAHDIDSLNHFNHGGANYVLNGSTGTIVNGTEDDPGFGKDRVHVPKEIDLIATDYNWTQIGNEWYARTSANVDANLPDPTIISGTGRSGVNINSVLATKGTVTSLAVGEWDFVDPASLGYLTLIVRITGNGDPQAQAAGYVKINGSPLSGSGVGGADRGAEVLFEVVDLVTTEEPLWNKTTGQYIKLGATVAGISDVAGSSLEDFHLRLNINNNGGKLPQTMAEPPTFKPVSRHSSGVSFGLHL